MDNFLFYNCCMEYQQLTTGDEGYLAGSEVLQTICDVDFQENGLYLHNPKTDYYHKYAKPPKDGMYLMKVARPAALTNIHVFIDTRLFPNFIWIEKIDGRLEECLEVGRVVESSLDQMARKYGWRAKLEENQLNEVHDPGLFFSAWAYINNIDIPLWGFANCTGGSGNQFMHTQNNYYYGNMSHGKAESDGDLYSDKQIAQALLACVGKGKVINNKQKMAGAYWFLRWVCNYPVDVQQSCEKIKSLPFESELEITCDYNNIRRICSCSFMDYDPRYLDKVKVSNMDQDIFRWCREIVLKLGEELRKVSFPHN